MIESTRGEESVSVVIPTYNRAYCLPRAIESALAQQHEPIEILVVDDGSTDETRALVQRLYGDDARVRYVYQSNRGVAAARNEGLRRCRGNLVAFLDSDDRWLPGKLALQLECLRTVPEAGMVWTDMEAVDPSGRVLHPRYLRIMYHAYRWFPKPSDLYDAEHVLPATHSVRVYSGDIYAPMVLGNLVHTSTVLLRRERWEKVGFFREEFRHAGEDYEFHLRVCREGRVLFADTVTTQYQVGAADRITRPELQWDMATAYITTLHEALERDPDRITLPKETVDENRAGAYAWAARAALDAGRGRDARMMYLRALRLRPLKFSAAKFLLVSLLPAPVRPWLFTTVRQLRRAIRSPKIWWLIKGGYVSLLSEDASNVGLLLVG